MNKHISKVNGIHVETWIPDVKGVDTFIQCAYPPLNGISIFPYYENVSILMYASANFIWRVKLAWRIKYKENYLDLDTGHD